MKGRRAAAKAARSAAKTRDIRFTPLIVDRARAYYRFQIINKQAEYYVCKKRGKEGSGGKLLYDGK